MSTRRLGALLGLLGGALLSLASAAHAAPFAYVTQSSAHTVAVVDTSTNTVVGAPIAVGFRPFGVAVHPSGSHVYVGNNEGDTVSVIETVGNTVAATIETGDFMRPTGLAMHPDGSRLYVARQFGASVAVVDTGLRTVVGSVDVGGFPLGLAVNPDGTRLYVVNNASFTVSVVDTGTLEVVDTVSVGGSPVGVAVDPTGARAYITNTASHSVSVLDTSTNMVTATVDVGDYGTFPRGVAVHPSGSHVYVATGSGQVLVISTATHTVVANPFAAAGLYGIAVTPSGAHVYAASETRNAMFVLATATNTVSEVPVAGMPLAFGQFITPEAASCDTSALEQALAAARQQVTSLQAANQAVTTDNGRLRSELASIRLTVESFVDRLFGERTDGNVASAARAAALMELAAARSAAPRDGRLRSAQYAFDRGEKAMRRRDWGHAVHSFRTVHELVERLIRGRGLAQGSQVPIPAGSPVSTPVATTAASGSCDATALEQALAAANQQIASLQATNQALSKENGQLQAELNTARSTLESFVDRLFGDRCDGNVATAAKAAALAKLNDAKSAKPGDWRLKSAGHSFDQGQYAMRRHDWRRAVHEFREAHEVAERVLADRKGHEHRHHHKHHHPKHRR